MRNIMMHNIPWYS